MNPKIILLAGTISVFLLGGNMATARGNLEEKVSSEVGIIYHHGIEDYREEINYLKSRTQYSGEQELLWRSSNIPELNHDEEIQIINIIKDIKNRNINSYQGFIEMTSNFSEEQNLVLLSAIGSILDDFYDIDAKNKEVVPQDIFFNELQTILESGNINNLGVCTQIHYYIEQLAKDIGIKASEVTGILPNGVGHAYTILKTENGTSIIDYNTIITTNTKNIEKALEAYQKESGNVIFWHWFFEDNEFKYRLITKEGNHFLEFIGYDETSESLKNALVSENERKPGISISYNHKDFLDYFMINYYGLFVKSGEMKGSQSSSLEKLILFQAGVDREFLIPKIIRINGDLSLLFGNIYQDKEFDDNETTRINPLVEIKGNGLIGVNGSLVISTDNKEGFNLSSRVARNFSMRNHYPLFYDFLVGGGISYKIPIEILDINPYAIVQFPIHLKSIDIQKYGLFSEFLAGIPFDFKILKDTIFSIDPYYSKKPWENEVGGNVDFISKFLKASIKGYVSSSDYEFTPDKWGYKIGLNLLLGNLNLGINYENEQENYDTEIEHNKLLNIQVGIKL